MTTLITLLQLLLLVVSVGWLLVWLYHRSDPTAPGYLDDHPEFDDLDDPTVAQMYGMQKGLVEDPFRVPDFDDPGRDKIS